MVGRDQILGTTFTVPFEGCSGWDYAKADKKDRVCTTFHSALSLGSIVFISIHAFDSHRYCFSLKLLTLYKINTHFTSMLGKCSMYGLRLLDVFDRSFFCATHMEVSPSKQLTFTVITHFLRLTSSNCARLSGHP